VWHHPLSGTGDDRIKDHGFLERLAVAGFHVGLHGHIHRASNELYRYERSAQGRRLEIIAAGTFGAPSHEWAAGYPLQYNLLQFQGRQLTVRTRRREEPNGAWKPDARWLEGSGKEPKSSYTLELSGA
jgi:3',5'-cyclic AMP phosphodiesterase CpdA